MLHPAYGSANIREVFTCAGYPGGLITTKDTSTLVTYQFWLALVLPINVLYQSLSGFVGLVADLTLLVLFLLASLDVPLVDPVIAKLLLALAAPCLLPNTMLIKLMHSQDPIIIAAVVAFIHRTDAPVDSKVDVFEMEIPVLFAGKTFGAPLMAAFELFPVCIFW